MRDSKYPNRSISNSGQKCWKRRHELAGRSLPLSRRRRVCSWGALRWRSICDIAAGSTDERLRQNPESIASGGRGDCMATQRDYDTT